MNEEAVQSIHNSFDPELSVDLDVDDSDYIPSHSMSQSEATYIEEPSIQQDSSFVMDQSTEYENSSDKHITEDSVRLSSNPYDNLEEPSIRIDPKWSEKTDQNELEPSLDLHHQQQEFELEDHIEYPSETIMLDDYQAQTTTPTESDTEAQLIDEVDQLIDDKILNQATDRPYETADDIFIGKKKKSASGLFAWLIVAPVLLILITGLTGSLIYQLWQKQLISWPDRKEVRDLIEPFQTPAIQKLEEFGVDIPVRRNLSALQLLSAKTEAHPSRASTILLRVSLINRAQIDQPLPWLELSLKNSDGKIISRRSLSPKDYIHNNRIGSDIGARELKKITIELLSFPKQAAGYELKLLNK